MAGKDQGIVFNVVFFVVLISSLVQGLSLGPLARALRLTTVKRAEPSHIVELHSLKESDVELLEFHIQQDSQGAYKRIADLGLGDQGLISAIIRQDRLVLPKGRTVLEPGDIVYVMVPCDQIQGVKKHLG
ncbi:TrkA C-terminal domain-containing protein [Treponema sp. J25]|uniref:TrkA C-terminal domain-containing protein n=1 Tax=Treponema sp. J25 TaxID=2094121 RepID=UPI001404601D|nr:TrkA C-terminal domain-containing protein [Treponema sp. J25]